MAEDPVQKIKERLDIVDVVKDYIKLEKAGANYRAICPFHSENKPSFFVSPARQIWHCFGCSEGGDMFEFVKKIEGVEFGDALRILARKAGVELKKQDPKLKTARKRQYEICELACKFFKKQLKESSKGKKAKEYLINRNINKESIEAWRLGYAPDSWHGLSKFLSNKGYETKEIVKAGLAIKKTDAKHYDRFRDRIMFPVFDLNSQVIGFGGRVFDQEEEVAKYMNTPNTLLYDKSKTLYGLNEAKVPIRKEEQCVLVEGYTDVILASQEGFKNVVASSGTSLTSRQLNVLNRYTDNLLCAFDMDVAGSSATKRGIDLAQEQGFNIKVVEMPEESDPADIISENPKKWEELVKKADSIVEFYINNAFSKFDAEIPEEKEKIANMVLPAIKRIPNEITKSHWIQQLSNKLGVDEESIRTELKKTQVKELEESRSERKEKEEEPKTREELIEERIAALVLKSPEHIDLVSEEHLACFNTRAKEVIRKLSEKDFSSEKDTSKLIRELDKELSEEETELLNYLCLKSEVLDEEKEEIEPELKVCLREIKQSTIRSKLNYISRQIQKAEQENDEKKIKKLMNKFSELSEKLNQSE